MANQRKKGYIEVPYRLTEWEHKKLCMGCMEPYEDTYKNCPRCGYIEGVSQEQQGSLETGTILNGAYVVGRVAERDAKSVTYVGRHILKNKKVLIKEYGLKTFDTKMTKVLDSFEEHNKMYDILMYQEKRRSEQNENNTNQISVETRAKDNDSSGQSRRNSATKATNKPKKKHSLLYLTVFIIGLWVCFGGRSGTCGANLEWKLWNGVLTISGTGEMTDYEISNPSSEVPWESRKDEVREIIIEDGVTSIGNCAFYDFENVTTVSLPDGITKIGDDAFAKCRNLQEIEIPEGVSYIGDTAFRICTSLRTVILPNSVTYIGASAFLDCMNLTEIVIPEGLQVLGGGAFQGCKSLNSVALPVGITELDSFTFRYCYNLKTVTLSEGIEKMGYSVFEGCINLATITIPASVERIEVETFLGCNRLESIYILNPACYLSLTSYTTIPTHTTIYSYEGGRVQEYAEKNGNEFIGIE